MTALTIPVTTKDHLQGDEKAPVILVEYGDYECPHCGRAYLIVKHLQRHFGDQLGFVFRNFPLTEIHPYAESAAVRRVCGGE
jgi:protein-disulfide isomerase